MTHVDAPAKLISLNAKRDTEKFDCSFHIQFADRMALAALLADAGGEMVGVKPHFKNKNAAFTPADNPRLFDSWISFRVLANTLEDMGMFFANSLHNRVDEFLRNRLVELGGKAKPSIIPSFKTPEIKTATVCCPTCAQPVADGPRLESLRINAIAGLNAQIQNLFQRKQSEMRDIEIRKLCQEVVELGGFFDNLTITHKIFEPQLNEVFSKNWTQKMKDDWKEANKSLAHQSIDFFMLAHEKQASRDQDAADLKSGKKTVEQLRKENSLIQTKGKIKEFR